MKSIIYSLFYIDIIFSLLQICINSQGEKNTLFLLISQCLSLKQKTTKQTAWLINHRCICMNCFSGGVHSYKTNHSLLFKCTDKILDNKTSCLRDKAFEFDKHILGIVVKKCACWLIFFFKTQTRHRCRHLEKCFSFGYRVWNRLKLFLHYCLLA